MTLILNILWFIFGGGFIAWLLWILTGGLLFVTVVGIPFAWAAFRIAGFAAFPFGKDLVDARDLGGERLIGTGLANFFGLFWRGSGWPYPISLPVPACASPSSASLSDSPISGWQWCVLPRWENGWCIIDENRQPSWPARPLLYNDESVSRRVSVWQLPFDIFIRREPKRNPVCFKERENS